MSRSYKKTPISKDNKRGRKAAKRFANKKVRKAKDLPSKQRKAFRKVGETWNIYDYVSKWTLEEAIEEWNEEELAIALGGNPNRFWWHARYENIEAYLNAVYYRFYRRK